MAVTRKETFRADDIKILIVNHVEEERNSISAILKNEEFIIFSASNSRNAVSKAAEISPDLIILDVEMPGIDGIELCKELRTVPGCAISNIMFLSSRVEDCTQIAALDAGADEYIIKPVRPRVLISRVNALMRRINRYAKNMPETAGTLLIDKGSHSIKVDKKEIYLSKKEFDLLNLLASKPGKVYSRQAIYEIVWNGNIDVSDRIIDVHIWKLRRKLGRKKIITLKGIGYKIDL